MWVLDDVFAHVQQLVAAFVELQEAAVDVDELPLLDEALLHLSFGRVLQGALALSSVITRVLDHPDRLRRLILEEGARDCRPQVRIVEAVVVDALERPSLVRVCDIIYMATDIALLRQR